MLGRFEQSVQTDLLEKIRLKLVELEKETVSTVAPAEVSSKKKPRWFMEPPKTDTNTAATITTAPAPSPYAKKDLIQAWMSSNSSLSAVIETIINKE